MTEIDAGVYWVRAKCPACGLEEEVSLTLSAQLTRVQDDATIGLKVGQKRVVHRCSQLQLRVTEVDGATGEVLRSGSGVLL